jgi:hypothetical protein
MKSLRSRLAEKVAATQDQAPAPTPNQSQSSNYSNFFNLVSEIRKLNQVINIKNMIQIVRELTPKLKNCNDPLEKFIIMEFSENMSV